MIIVEGSRNTGKSFLIEILEQENPNYIPYKVPFVNYFNTFLKSESGFDSDNADEKVWHHTTGYDIALLSAQKAGLLLQGALVDRGFVSNVVLGIAGGRITRQDGEKYVDYIIDNFISSDSRVLDICMVFVYGDKGGRTKDAEVSKDDWHVLNKEKTDAEFKHFENLLRSRGVRVIVWNNDFTSESLEEIVNTILIECPSEDLPF